MEFHRTVKASRILILLAVILLPSCTAGQGDDVEIDGGQVILDLYIRIENSQVYATVSNPADWMWNSGGKGVFTVNGLGLDAYDSEFDFYSLNDFSYERGDLIQVQCSYDGYGTVSMEGRVPEEIMPGFDPGISPPLVPGQINTNDSYTVIPVNPGNEVVYKFSLWNFKEGSNFPDSGYGWYARDRIGISSSQLTLSDGNLTPYLDIEIVPMQAVRDSTVYQSVDLHICSMDKSLSSNRL